MPHRYDEPQLASWIVTVLLALGGVWLMASPWQPPREALQVTTTTVLLRSQIEQMVHPTYVTLTPEDVWRGWIELPARSHLTIYNNCRAGYRLIVETIDAPWLDQLVVRLPGTDTPMPAAGGSLAMPWAGAGRKGLELSYRFQLRAGTVPGTYPWPVRLSTQPAVQE